MENYRRPVVRQPQKASKQASNWQGIGCIAVLLLPVVIYMILWAAGGFLVIADPLRNVQAVVVLSGDDGTRLKFAATLFRQQAAQYLIITETGERIPEVRPSLSDMAVKRAIDYGVEEDQIIVTNGKSQSTADEANAVKEAADNYGIKRLIVVTDPYHTFRTRLIFRDRLDKVKVIVRPVTEHWYRSNTWFLSAAGWRETGSEYLKITAYLVGFHE